MLKCEDNLKKTTFYTFARVDQVYDVTCPQYCLNTEATVWGTTLYHEGSSVCRAAIHAGMIKDDLGGQITVVMIENPKKFQASSAHAILSQEL